MNYHNKKQKRVNRNTLKTHKKQPNLNKTNQMMAAEKVHKHNHPIKPKSLTQRKKYKTAKTESWVFQELGK